jgi:hypothetical protein
VSNVSVAEESKRQHHPWVELHKSEKPVKVFDQLPRDNAVSRFNAWLAVKITKAVGSMWCAYLFAAFDMLSLPAAIRSGIQAIVSWVAQTFLQLVLLSIIMVGQDVQAKAADKRADQTYQDAEALLHETQIIDNHLAEQDKKIDDLETKVLQHLAELQKLVASAKQE